MASKKVMPKAKRKFVFGGERTFRKSVFLAASRNNIKAITPGCGSLYLWEKQKTRNLWR